MVITIISDVLGTANNGTTLATLNLINSLKAKGHVVRVLCCDKNYAGKENYFIIPTVNFWIFNSYVKHNGVSLAKVDQEVLQRAIDGADIVHSFLPFAAGRAAARYCLKKKIPFTSGFHAQAENLTSHVFLMNFKLANSAVYRNFWKHYYCMCDAIHYPTAFIRDYVRRFMKGPVPYTISNGVDMSLFNRKEKTMKPDEYKDKFVIVMSGRLSAEKKQILLLKAARKCKHRNDIQLIIAGGGPKDRMLKRWAKRHYKKNLPIIKSFQHEDLHNILLSADLYVHTSLIEIEAISCIEALACGLVPIISNSPRSATSKFALLPQSSFTYYSSSDLARKIDWWIDHPEERHQAAQKYAQFAQQFDVNICMDQMEQMLIQTKENYTGKKPWLKGKKAHQI